MKVSSQLATKKLVYLSAGAALDIVEQVLKKEGVDSPLAIVKEGNTYDLYVDTKGSKNKAVIDFLTKALTKKKTTESLLSQGIRVSSVTVDPNSKSGGLKAKLQMLPKNSKVNGNTMRAAIKIISKLNTRNEVALRGLKLLTTADKDLPSSDIRVKRALVAGIQGL